MQRQDERRASCGVTPNLVSPLRSVLDIVGIIERDDPEPTSIKRLPAQVAWRETVRP